MAHWIVRSTVLALALLSGSQRLTSKVDDEAEDNERAHAEKRSAMEKEPGL